MAGTVSQVPRELRVMLEPPRRRLRDKQEFGAPILEMPEMFDRRRAELRSEG